MLPQLCYYQALEFAIERGLRRVEAGAQGGSHALLPVCMGCYQAAVGLRQHPLRQPAGCVSPAALPVVPAGEHKIQRGYVPSLTYSLHYTTDPGFSGVVAR